MEVFVKHYLLTDFGGIGDGSFDNSASFAQAFGELKEGDSLAIGKGVWKTGPLTLRAKNVEIVLEAGSRIVFSDDEELYEPVFSRWEGVNCYCMHPCFYIVDSENIHISGSGVIDGNGQKWWTTSAYKREFQTEPVTKQEKQLALLNPGYQTQSGGGGGRQSQFLRPPLVQIHNSDKVTMEGISLENSPFWTLHPLYSKNITFKELSIVNPKDAPNTDGMDIDSCEHVTISECFLDVGDDGIALKSGSGLDGIETNRPTKDVTILQCTVRNAHGGAVIGSETAAGIHNIEVSDCLFDGTDRGIRIKTRRGRGGAISNLLFSGIMMENNVCPLTINMYYRCGSFHEEDFSLKKLPLEPTTPSIHDVIIRNCRATGITSTAGFIVGLPESPITNLSIEDCDFALAVRGLVGVSESEMYSGLEDAKGRGIRLRNVHLQINHLKITGVKKDLLIEEGAKLNEA